VERGIGRGSTAPTATGEGVDSMSNYGQHGQQTPTNSDGPQPSSHLHRDPDDRDHVDLRQTQESDDGERSCPEPRAEPEGEVASNDEPSAPDSRRQLGEPQHTSDAKGNNTPQQPGCTSASGNERVQPQKPPGEPCGVPKAPPEKQKQKPKTDKEWARHWYEKSGSHEAEVKKLQNAISKLRKNFAEEREQLDSTREELFREKTRLKKRLDTLQTSHIHSVNSVGTGLEPISDQTFEDRFRALQDEVCCCIPVMVNSNDILGQRLVPETFQT
jgi:hypothetical protein